MYVYKKNKSIENEEGIGPEIVGFEAATKSRT